MDIHGEFKKLFYKGDHKGIVNLLSDYIKTNDLPMDEIGWAYWNISDSYAMMRVADLEYENHVKFVNWGKQVLYPERLHWFVSDATQALTLSLSKENHFEKWYEWYLYACKHSSKTEENRGVRFESHRAAAGAAIILKRIDKFDIPFKNMHEVLQEDRSWTKRLFAEIEYLSLSLERYHILGQAVDIDFTLAKVYKIIKEEVNTVILNRKQYKTQLLGSWTQLNSNTDTKEEILVALNNLGCTLCSIKRCKESIDIFDSAIQYGIALDKYALAHYILALLRAGSEKDYILSMFERMSQNRFVFEDLYSILPELQQI
jgi:tetratricopeptide (TPR) repeat protein